MGVLGVIGDGHGEIWPAMGGEQCDWVMQELPIVERRGEDLEAVMRGGLVDDKLLAVDICRVEEVEGEVVEIPGIICTILIIPTGT